MASRESTADAAAPKKGTVKKKRAPKHKDTEKEKRKTPAIVTTSFATNQYTGIVASNSVGARHLEGASAKYTWEHGTRYEGPFVNSQITGRGKYHWPDGSTYEGELFNGRRHGEGVFTTADGNTKYEGQWREGQRHGVGRLSYDVYGESFYFGGWEDGCKHGEGRQVWPSGNTYNGQWRQGKMSGQGTMVWLDGITPEQYSGNWEDNQPQGVGTYTWHPPEQGFDSAGPKDMPSQQMNNRYQGQWNKGSRHGDGTFFYANGATYSGSWLDNVRHGMGRHTFQDGRVYNGNFDLDSMTDRGGDHMAGAKNKAALNIGAEDNPVRQCIDISDLDFLALPPDVGEHDFSTGSGYDEPHEVMREVHNMLLRNLGTLKNLYATYRSLLHKPGEDPFVLTVHQLWLFARDYDLVTPLCSLSTLNRWLTAGPRHHQETAFDDMEHLRPLTPPADDARRPMSISPGAKSSATENPDGAATEADMSRKSLGATSTNRLSIFGEAATEESITGEDAEESAGSGTEACSGQEESPAGEGDDADEAKSEALTVTRKQSQLNPEDCETVLPRNHIYFREEGSENLANIHDPSRVMMFRHFLEGIVRLAVARFPHEKGLERQLSRMFKEKIEPRFKSCAEPSSQAIFAFLVDPPIQDLLKEFDDVLWSLFKKRAAGGEGPYTVPQWATVVLDDCSGTLGTAGPSLVDLAVPPTPMTPKANASLAKFPSMSTFEIAPSQKIVAEPVVKQGLGGPKRRVHLRARLDVTMRIKDVLQLLEDMGFVAEPMTDTMPSEEQSAGPAVVFPPPPSTPTPVEDAMAATEDLKSLKDILGAAEGQAEAAPDKLLLPVVRRGEADVPASATDAASEAGTAEASAAAGGQLSPSDRTRAGLGAGVRKNAQQQQHGTAQHTPIQDQSSASGGQHDSIGSIREDAAGEAAEMLVGKSVVASQASLQTFDCKPIDVLKCDFTIGVLELLRLMVEVCSPESVRKIRWFPDIEEKPTEETVALLDFLETEVTFCEFQRLLLRLAERQTALGPPPCGLMALAQRFEGFLRHVFVPALSAPYLKPEPPSVAEEAAADAEEQADATLDAPPAVGKGSGAAAVPSAEAAEDKDGDAGADAEVEEAPPSPLPFWRGFLEPRCESEVNLAPRVWPKQFEQLLADW